MKIVVYDEYGEKQEYKDVSVVFSSITTDNVLCIKFKNEPNILRFDLSKLNYWEIINE